MGAGCGCVAHNSKELNTYNYDPTFANVVFSSRTVELAIKQLGLFYDSELVYIPKKLIPYYHKVLDGRYQMEQALVVETVDLGQTGADYLCKLIPFYTHVTEFRMWKTDASLESLDRVFAALRPLSLLKKLSLENNGLKEDSLSSLVREFNHMSGLEELWLASNAIYISGAKILTESLHYLPRLHTLSLSNNYIGSAACIYLCKKLITRRRLKVLLLQANMLDSEAIPALLSLAHTNSPVNMVDVSRNAFSATDCETLSAAFKTEVINVTSQK